MPIYRSTGTLTGTIERENVATAQAYLQADDMTQYLDDSIAPVIERVQWYLDGNGHDYYVEAVTARALNDDELRVLAEWVSGQNSDGLGEGFEQQGFAWLEDEQDEHECEECDGSGVVRAEDCPNCDGAGYLESDGDGRMISFDWQTNESTFTRVA